MEMLLLLLGAIVGVAADRLTNQAKRQLDSNKKRRFLERRAAGSNPIAVRQWLLKYYGESELYRCTISGAAEHISLLVDPDWCFQTPLEGLAQIVEEVHERQAKDFRVDEHLIDLRRAAGQRIFNNLTYYVASISDPGRPLRIQIGQTDYFSVITNLITLEEEVFDAVRKNSLNAPTHNIHLIGLGTARKTTLKPLSFGVAVGLVLTTPESGPRILLHKRSSETVTHSGSRALFPSFGLAPIGSQQLSIDNLVYLNFVKEYLEEGYDYDELVDNLSDRRANSQWFMSLPEAREIDEARRSGDFRLTALGYGIDCLSGTGTLALLAEVSDGALSARIQDHLTGNWEVADRTISSPALELIPLDSPRLGAYLSAGELHAGSAFTIEQIQRYYSTP